MSSLMGFMTETDYVLGEESEIVSIYNYNKKGTFENYKKNKYGLSLRLFSCGTVKGNSV